MATRIVPLPWLSPPLSLNDRDHWRPRAAKEKAARQIACIAARNIRLPAMPAAIVVLCWRVPNWGRRDLDNMAASLKPAIDGLVDAGVLPDDDWRHVIEARTRIIPPERGRPPAMWLEVTPAVPHGAA